MEKNKGNRKLKATSLKGKKARIMNGDLGETPLLGHIIGYTIRGCEIPINKIDEMWEDLNLPQWSKPNKLRPKDVFKNAVRTLEKERTWRHPKYGPVVINLVTDKAPKENEYFFTRKVFASDDKTEKNMLEHEKLYRINFIGISNKITVEKYEKESPVSEEKCKSLSRDLNHTFEAMMKVYNNVHITRAIRDTIKGLDGVPYTCGQGGVWFIPIEGENIMAGWKRFLEIVADDYTPKSHRYPTQLRALPCVDSEEQKRFVAQDVARQTEAKFTTVLEDTMKQLKSCNPDHIEEILARKLQARIDDYDLVKKYERLLGTKIELYMEGMKDKEVKKLKTREKKPLSGRAQAMLKQLSNIE